MLYAISNLASSQAFGANPWEYKTDVPEEVRVSKAAFSEWCMKPTTKNCHFSAAEGLDPLMRVSKENPAVVLHGLIADYDSEVSKEMISNLVEKSPTEFVPNWGSLTFSHGGRLVWMFEEPVTLTNSDVTKAFLKLVAKKLKLVKLLPGFDADAFFDAHKYYEKGREWMNLSNDTIPTNFVHQWMYEAGGKVRWDSDRMTIPMDIISKEVQARFPGIIKGPFEDGTRCPRFWEPEYHAGYDQNGCVVRPTGIQCFSGVSGFISWAEILGTKFVEQFEADKTGEIIADMYYDGKLYWRKNSGGTWLAIPKEDFKLLLKVKYGLSTFCTRKETCSEVDKVSFAVQEQKAVACALPFVHFPSGVINRDGIKYLNTSSAVCVEPSSEGGEWGEKFPWLAEFIDGYFDPAEQKDYFLSWWKHFYENAWKHKPRQGQALFIAGDPGVGKTLMSTAIVSRSVGGHVDASAYLLGEEKFTSHVVASPVMSVDDTVPASDTRRHTRYSAMIKKIAANRTHTYEEKFQKAGQVTWLGRVVVTCNLDPESVRLLPNVELSLLDKISLFKCASREIVFPESQELLRTINTELPYLLRWLLDWEIPEHCKGASRFGVKSYHESHLFSAALQTSASYSFLELLTDFLSSYSEGEDLAAGVTCWEGTATQLLSDMTLDARLGSIASRHNPNQMATFLGQLSARGFSLERIQDTGQRIWRIPFNLINEVQEMEEREQGERK